MPAGSVAMLAAAGGCESELEQAVALHAADGVAAPAELPLGEGDRRLLSLYRRLTGREVEVTVACEACGTENAAVLAPETVPPSAPRCARLGAGGGVRAPTYGDLAELPVGSEQAAAELLRRCTVGSPSRRPRASDLAGVDDSLCGPLAMACAECGAPIEAGIDAEQVVLELLERHAAEVDREVHLLASAYGWALESIERLPDQRRHRLARLIQEAR